MKGKWIWMHVAVSIFFLMGVSQTPPEAAISSRYLDIWIQYWNGQTWIPISATGPMIHVEAYEHPEILLKEYDHELYHPIEKCAYYYRMHPPVEVRYRFLMKVDDNFGYPVGLLLTIDGLNTVDSRSPSGSACQDRFWVLYPGTFYSLLGYQATESEALAFYFSSTREPHAPKGSPYGQIVARVFLPEEALYSCLEFRPREPLLCLRPLYMDLDQDMDIATVAGEIVHQSTYEVSFTPLTCTPIETIVISYASSLEPFLGVVVKTNEYFGVTVQYVVPWSPAGRAGIRAGQIISKVEGQLIYSAEQLRRIILSKHPGETITIQIHGEAEARTVVLGEW